MPKVSFKEVSEMEHPDDSRYSRQVRFTPIGQDGRVNVIGTADSALARSLVSRYFGI